MAAKTGAQLTAEADAHLAELGLIPVDEVPKSRRVDTRSAKFAEVLTAEHNIGKTFQLPPTISGITIQKAVEARGLWAIVKVRGKGEDRKYYVTVVTDEPEKKTRKPRKAKTA